MLSLPDKSTTPHQASNSPPYNEGRPQEERNRGHRSKKKHDRNAENTNKRTTSSSFPKDLSVLSLRLSLHEPSRVSLGLLCIYFLPLVVLLTGKNIGPLPLPCYRSYRVHHLQSSTLPMMFPPHFLLRLAHILRRRTSVSWYIPGENGPMTFLPVAVL